MHDRPCIQPRSQHVWLVLAVLLALHACDNSASGEASGAATVDQHDASTRSTRTGVDAATDASVVQAPKFHPHGHDVPLNPEDPERLTRWKGAPEFSLSFSAQGRQVYDMSLDQAGRFHYEARTRMPRPGTYDTLVEPQLAQALYNEVLALGYLRLDEWYADQTQRGVELCGLEDPNVEDIKYFLDLKAAGEGKRLVYFSACSNTGPAFDALKAIVEAFRAWPPLESFIASEIEPCYEIDNRLEKLTIENWQTNYVIFSEQDQPLGTLQFVEPPERLKSPDVGYAVRVATCDSEDLFVTVGVVNYSCGFSIVPEQSVTTFRFPGLDHEVNAALIGIDKDSVQSDSQQQRWKLRLLDGPDKEATLYVRPGLSCQD